MFLKKYTFLHEYNFVNIFFSFFFHYPVAEKSKILFFPLYL